MIKAELKKALIKAASALGLPVGDFGLEHPAESANGDYSTNMAMVVAKQMGKNPREVAQTVKDELDRYSLDFLDRVEIAGPGFINFYLSEHFLRSEMETVLRLGENFGTGETLQEKRIVVEYTDPNPFKEFHVGHLYSNIVGESIVRLLEANGATVWRADYFGDVGMHVAKALWGLMKKMAEDGLTMDELGKRDLRTRIEYFGQAYAVGATAYEVDEQAKEAMKEINFLAFKAAQEVVLPTFQKASKYVDYDQFIKPGSYTYEQIRDLYAEGRAWSLEYFETIYERLGTEFDGYYPESMTGEYGYQMVMDGLSKGIFERGEGGAIIFPGEKYGLHNRVFINALGLPTYETKDFGNAVAKNADFPYDQSVIVTGNEINEYFEVVLEAMRRYKPELGKVTRHIGHGMVRLPEGKMSSRTGRIVRGEDVLEEAKARVMVVMENREIEQVEAMAELVSQAAIKYAFLKQGIGKDISFDFDASLSFEGNSGPYLQYTAVRARAVLGKAGMLQDDKIAGNEFSHHVKANAEETAILRWLYRFPEVVGQAAAEFAPHLVATYLYELAGRFNGFYNKHTVVQASDDIRLFRVLLVACSYQILVNGMLLLGIKVPEKM